MDTRNQTAIPRVIILKNDQWKENKAHNMMNEVGETTTTDLPLQNNENSIKKIVNRPPKQKKSSQFILEMKWKGISVIIFMNIDRVNQFVDRNNY